MMRTRIIPTALALALLGPMTPVQAQSLPSQLSNCLAIYGTVERLACYDRIAHAVAGGQPLPAPAYAPAYRPPATAYVAPPAAGLGSERVPRPAPPVQAYYPPAASYAAPPPPRPTVQDFGSERLPQTPERMAGQVNRVAADVTNFTLDLRGRFTVSLSNGQVWRQLEGDDATTRARKGMTSVRIERAVLGSYILKFNDSNKTFKVSRVQ